MPKLTEVEMFDAKDKAAEMLQDSINQCPAATAFGMIFGAFVGSHAKYPQYQSKFDPSMWHVVKITKKVKYKSGEVREDDWVIVRYVPINALEPSPMREMFSVRLGFHFATIDRKNFRTPVSF